VCFENPITLNTNKTRVGHESANFFGFTVSKRGTRLAEKHLDPIRTLVPPSYVGGLRRVLGLFVVPRRYIENYAVITKPLTDLLRGRQPSFEWGPSQQAAFEDTRDRLLGGIHLAAPDYELPFHLAADASEGGKGAVLCQLPSVLVTKQHPWSACVHHPQNVAIIQFLSKAWNDAQRNRPPFYLEADGLLWATDKYKFYALSSPLSFYTHSDHLPLQWMKTSTKGPVSQFMIENLSELDVIHQHVTGPSNSIADAVSRHPLLGPQRLAPRGIAHSLACLLAKLPAGLKQSKVVHVHAAADTPDFRRLAQEWLTTANAATPSAPVRQGTPPAADLAMLIPRPEMAPVTLALFFFVPPVAHPLCNFAAGGLTRTSARPSALPRLSAR
jgi:hypothetical protein